MRTLSKVVASMALVLSACPDPTELPTGNCASSSIGCQPGDPCTNDAECRSGGDSAASCDATGNVCVTVCGTTTIVSPLHLDATKFCREIDGDLRIEPDFPSLDASAFPYLTRVRGNLLALTPTGAPAAQSITFSALQTVDGDLKVGPLANLTRLSLPRLQSAHVLAVVSSPKLEHVSLPVLTTVRGALALANLRSLVRLDIGALRTVEGDLSLQGLCELPWSQANRISTLGTTQAVHGIGCCSSTDRYACGNPGECNCQ
jgi:hypothetical protein